MYQVTGEILNLFSSPASDKYEASYKVQMLGETLTIDGQVKKEMNEKIERLVESPGDVFKLFPKKKKKDKPR